MYQLPQAAHKSLIHDAIKEGDEEFLAEVLEALNKKYGQSEDSLEAYVKREDNAEGNICIEEETTNNGNIKESENIIEASNQKSSEEHLVEEDTKETQNEEESKESLEKHKVKDENSNSEEELS